MKDVLQKIRPYPWKAHGPVDHYSETPDLYEIHWSEHGECVAEIVHGEAEAHLFAAAPDMYKLLCELEVVGDPIEKLCLVCAQKPDEHLHWCDIGNALAKARGESS